ncbi:MAG: ATP-dependent DNA ligase [Myxococcaceae bacterium]|jgi:ATP-dependent DNA ligase|nr:ATP-dependent DNA ligase [Myxococcaceae bacterium]MCA3014780.1 ATP-dependent DNA ligase [Myxococcaceae bacterium]
MLLPFAPPFEPMLAQARDDLPVGPGWRYEPKWDGFRALVFRDGEALELSSRESRPLARYFPELVEALKQALPSRCVVDGEIILPGPKGLDFEALQSRLHPAASRVKRLSAERPTCFVAFDLLALGDDDWRERQYAARREGLEREVRATASVFVTPQTQAPAEAARWFTDFEGAGCDGVIARPEGLPYCSGQRVLVKVKHGRTADCVVGGYRAGKTPGTVGSLLLGLYDEAGVLHHVGHTSSFTAKEKRALVEHLAPHLGGESFGKGRTPDAPSRWSPSAEKTWVALRPQLVCEVRYDFLQGARFRHATTFLRWRDDRSPASCTFSQLDPPRPFSLDEIRALAPRARG